MKTKFRLLNWQRWLQDGDQYLNAATPKGIKSKFGTDITYNLLSMSLEGYIMGILDFLHKLPENHTYTDLIEALEWVISLDPALKKRILQYENIQSICSIDKYIRENPSDEDIVDLHAAVKEISLLAHEICTETITVCA